ncbi:MAG: hypothetical protein WB689_29765 [Xanthobacteraceae bacterium]
MAPKTKTPQPSLPTELHSKRQPPTSEQVGATQRRLAEKDLAAVKANLPVPTASTAVAAPDNRTSVQRYIDSIDNPSFAHRRIKFGKDGVFVTVSDSEPVPEGAEFFALCGETRIYWIKFDPEGGSPGTVSGLLYENFALPPRESLGDTDPAKWPTGLSGQPTDAWQHGIDLVLQQTDTKELFVFTTTSQTGRRAVGNLLRHYDRMRRTNPNDVPVVRLRAGGFQHKDARIGWVATPLFQIVGRAPRDSGAVPDTSIAADMNDELPGF